VYKIGMKLKSGVQVQFVFDRHITVTQTWIYIANTVIGRLEYV